MNPEMKRRLEAIEDARGSNADKRGVLFIRLKGETDMQCDQRIARWYAGEEVEGQDRVYPGNTGILQIWKSVGPVLDAAGNRQMVKRLDIVNSSVGSLPSSIIGGSFTTSTTTPRTRPPKPSFSLYKETVVRSCENKFLS